MKDQIRALIALTTLSNCVKELDDVPKSASYAKLLESFIQRYNITCTQKQLDEVKKEIHQHQILMLSKDPTVRLITKVVRDIPLENKQKYFAAYSYIAYIKKSCKKYLGKNYNDYVAPLEGFINNLIDEIFKWRRTNMFLRQTTIHLSDTIEDMKNFLENLVNFDLDFLGYNGKEFTSEDALSKGYENDFDYEISLHKKLLTSDKMEDRIRGVEKFIDGFYTNNVNHYTGYELDFMEITPEIVAVAVSFGTDY